jgi:hypothetical protein
MLDFQGIVTKILQALSFGRGNLKGKKEAAGMVFLPLSKTIKAYFLISLHSANDLLSYPLAPEIFNVVRR